MVDKQQIKQDIYANGQYSKVKDFFIGVGLFIALGFASNAVVTPFFFLSQFFPAIAFILYPLGEALFIGACILVYRKYYPGRRFVVIGMVSWLVIGFLLLLLIFGACLLLFSGMGP